MPSMFDSSARFAATCSAHADALLHLCVWHPSGNGQSAWLWGALALLAGYAAWLAYGPQWVFGVLGEPCLDGAPKLASGATQTNFACLMSISLWRWPVASGMATSCFQPSLMRRLDPTQLRGVGARTGSHRQSRVLHRLIAVVLSSIQLPGTRRRLLRDLELALEQRCDFAAANEVGFPVAVAETIVAGEDISATRKEQVPLAMAFFPILSLSVSRRCLSPKHSSVSCLGPMLGILVLAFCSLSTGWLHSVTESLITVMTR